MIRNLLRSPI